MTELLLKKDKTLFGTQIYNHKTKKIGLVIYTWTNRFADKDIPFATCVDSNGKRYNVAMDEIQPIEDLDEDELKELGLK